MTIKNEQAHAVLQADKDTCVLCVLCVLCAVCFPVFVLCILACSG